MLAANIPAYNGKERVTQPKGTRERPRGIHGITDIRAIEALPYEAFMPHQSVFDALESSANCHPDRRALTFIESADPSVASTSWTYSQFIEQVRRAAQVFTELAAGDSESLFHAVGR